MAKKETTTKKATAPKKASKQAKPKAVDMVTPVTPADETGLELTEEMVQEPVITEDVVEVVEPKGDEALVDPNEPMIDFQEDKEIEQDKKVVEEEACETIVTDHPEEEVCTTDAQNQELEVAQEPLFHEDKKMVNDITNILNGIDGVKASKIGEDDEDEEPGDVKMNGKGQPANTNTEEKNYYSEQFSRNWGGVMYDY